jgi:hypothetical protein
VENEKRNIVRRGYDNDDSKWFSAAAIEKLRSAQKEIQWLLDRGYKINTVINFVGGHYQLSIRQRNALQRATSSSIDCESRTKKLLSLEKLKEDCIYIDGFNLIITLEVALSGGTLILGNDGTIRDLAGLRGTYRLIDKTDIALTLLGTFLSDNKVKQVKFLIDAPVSNSGRLKSVILQHSIKWGISTEVELAPNVDRILSTMGRIVTTDSVILNSCLSWFNISRNIIESYISNPQIIDIIGV